MTNARSLAEKAFGATVLLVVLVMATGCQPQPAPRREVADAPPARAMDAAMAVLTLDANALHDRWLLFRAEQQLDQRCMRALDLTYLVTDPGPEPGPNVVTADDAGHAAPYTYGLAPAFSGITAQDAYVAALPAPAQTAYAQALNGLPDDRAGLRLPSGASGSFGTKGCVGWARAQLYGEVRSALEDVLVPQDVRNTFLAKLGQDAGYRSALDEWRRCMAAKGIPAAAPSEAIDSIRSLAASGADPELLTQRQAAVADADVGCDARAHVRARATAARHAFLAQHNKELVRWLERIHDQRRASVSKATTILTNVWRFSDPLSTGQIGVPRAP